ncbi:hypothetical protein BDY24DRAFT_393154 [Mrakia frigida]|uniref:uncharacterized protein n=1 Tax=Mrakia frigida TaxID=29902 RepID=UPI003FCBFC7A
MYNQGYQGRGGGGGFNPQIPPHLAQQGGAGGPPPPSGPRRHGNYPTIGGQDFSVPPPGYNGPPLGQGRAGGPGGGGFPNFPPPGFRGPPPRASHLPPIPPPVQQKELSAQTTLFVGSISPGVTDQVLEQLLNACGPLKMLKRVRGATGKPQAFGFAEYQDPDSVLRALVVLSGVELPDLENRGPGKKLLVKVDDNTRKFLDEYQAQMVRTDTDDQLELSAVKSITAILEALTNGTALPTSTSTALASSNGNPNPAATAAPAIDPFAVPEHLRDLQAADLPEESRDGVLDQIAMFRVQAVEREQAKKKLEEENERRRIEAMIFEQNATRMREQQAATRAKEMASEKEREKDRLAGSSSGGAFGTGPQGWSKPVGFVPASGSGIERTDEEEEELRKEKRRRDQADSLRERERRFEQRERQRLVLIDREIASERQRNLEEDQDHRSMKEKLARWDDDEQEERGRDLWYADRPRWRSQRTPLRRREEEADEADRRAEIEETAALQRESEDFLNQQMQDLADLAVKQKAAGILADDVAPIKLNIVAKPPPPPPSSTTTTAPVASTSSGEVTGGGGRVFVEEEEEETKKKRVLVKLDYGDGLTTEERELKRVQGLAKIKLEKLPKTTKGLFESAVKWEAITETIIEKKLQPLVRKKVIVYLGEMEDDDLLNFVLDHIRERKSASDLVEGLEMILEDEATPFAVSIWRAVLFESIASSEGLETKEMTVE